MCYLVRQQQLEAQPAATAPSPGSDGLRPRWVGAAAATLLGGLALAAALVVAPSTPPSLPSAQADGIPAARTARVESLLPTAATGEQRTALPADDDVPTITGASKAGAGHCDHGM